MLPYFAGERTPIMDPEARGVIAGLTVAHTRGDLYRAALEATAFGVRHNIEIDAAAGRGRSGAWSPSAAARKGGLWTQIVSDVTGLAPGGARRDTIGASYGGRPGSRLRRSRRLGSSTAWNPVRR